MSWQTPRERDFSLSGPFLIKRAGNAGDLELTQGQIITQAEFNAAGVHDRTIQRMYAAHWMDMLPLTGTGGLMEALGGGTPTKLTGLAAALHAAALHAASLTETAPGRESGKGPVQDTQNTENTPEGPENGPESDDGEAEGSAGGDNADTATEAGAAGDSEGQPTAPTDPVVVAYKSFGFGKYWSVNAAGEKLGDRLTKTQAEGFANSAQLPLLGQADAMPSA